MMPRLKSGMWVSAYLRRLAHEGVNAVVVRHGADDAGSVFVKVARLDGSADLYGPAPQAAFEAGEAAFDRLFECLAARAPEAEIDRRLATETRFDPDLWSLEVEDRAGRSFLTLMRPPRADPF